MDQTMSDSPRRLRKMKLEHAGLRSLSEPDLMHRTAWSSTSQDSESDITTSVLLKLCRYLPLGLCSRDDLCKFAHSDARLRRKPDWSRTRLCRTLLKRGVCKRRNCCYAHTLEELYSVGTDHSNKDSIVDALLSSILTVMGTESSEQSVPSSPGREVGSCSSLAGAAPTASAFSGAATPPASTSGGRAALPAAPPHGALAHPSGTAASAGRPGGTAVGNPTPLASAPPSATAHDAGTTHHAGTPRISAAPRTSGHPAGAKAPPARASRSTAERPAGSAQVPEALRAGTTPRSLAIPVSTARPASGARPPAMSPPAAHNSSATGRPPPTAHNSRAAGRPATSPPAAQNSRAAGRPGAVAAPQRQAAEAPARSHMAEGESSSDHTAGPSSNPGNPANSTGSLPNHGNHSEPNPADNPEGGSVGAINAMPALPQQALPAPSSSSSAVPQAMRGGVAINLTFNFASNGRSRAH